MAFSYVNWDKSSAQANTNVRKVLSYLNSSDTLATIEAADYFLSVYSDLNEGDQILVYGSNGYETLNVTAASSSTVTTATLAQVPANSITNNDVNTAAAIAFSKLAALTSGNIIVGSVANVPTSVAMAGDITIIAAGTTAIGANKVLSSMVSPLLIKYAAVAISAVEFNGMYAAPKALVAAGGANTLLVLHGLDLLMTYVSANYAAGGVAAVQYDSTANGAGVIASTTLAASTFQAAASTGFKFNAGVVAQTFSTCVNKGLYLSNVTGAFTTGDSTFVAHVWYSVVPTV